MTQPTETRFNTYWRELDAALIAEDEVPATAGEAVMSFSFGAVSIADSVGSIIKRRIALVLSNLAKAA